MTNVVVSRGALHLGELPPVCVVTGRPADGTVDVRFESLPGWTYLLLLFGVLPFLIASLFATERISGQVPVARETVVRFHARRRRSRRILVAGGVGSAFAILTGSPWLVWPSVALLAAGSAAWIWTYRSFVHGLPHRGGALVELRRVHPRFAAAVRDQYAMEAY